MKPYKKKTLSKKSIIKEKLTSKQNNYLFKRISSEAIYYKFGQIKNRKV